MQKDNNLKFFEPEIRINATAERLVEEEKAQLEKLKNSPNDIGVVFDLGTVYIQMENIPAAVDMFEKCLKINSLNPEVHFLLGNCYIRHNQFEIAARYYIKSLKLNSSHTPSIFNLGLCYVHIGVKQKAKNAFKKFYTLEKSIEWKEEAKFQLFKLGVKL